jgi:hypothetical protein
VDNNLLPHRDQWNFLASLSRLTPQAIYDLIGEAEARDRVLSVRMALADDNDDEPWRQSPSRRRPAHARQAFDEAHKAQPTDGPSHAKSVLDFIRELYRIESPLWDREHPVSAEERVRIRCERSAPVIDRFHRWLEGLAPQVVPQRHRGGCQSQCQSVLVSGDLQGERHRAACVLVAALRSIAAPSHRR